MTAESDRSKLRVAFTSNAGILYSSLPSARYLDVNKFSMILYEVRVKSFARVLFLVNDANLWKVSAAMLARMMMCRADNIEAFQQ